MDKKGEWFRADIRWLSLNSKGGKATAEDGDYPLGISIAIIIKCALIKTFYNVPSYLLLSVYLLYKGRGYYSLNRAGRLCLFIPKGFPGCVRSLTFCMYM